MTTETTLPAATTLSSAARLSVGVLGGMGPETTLDFMAKVVRATPAGVEQHHIRMLVDHNPTVPDRHDAIAGRIPSIGPRLAAMAEGLERSGADFLVMPCNAAHAFQADVVAFMQILYRVKAGDRTPALRDALLALAHRLEAEGADVLIAGCTQIPLLLDCDGCSLPMLSSTDLLVAETVRRSLAGH
jgi:aspartate/glutamate racemase